MSKLAAREPPELLASAYGFRKSQATMSLVIRAIARHKVHLLTGLIDIADRTAKWLGVEIFKRDVTEERLANDFANAAFHCEHHHFDLNAVAKFALSTLPHEHGVTVVLTGEGSDEHFAGYPYFPAEFLREPDLSQPDTPLARDNVLRQSM